MGAGTKLGAALSLYAALCRILFTRKKGKKGLDQRKKVNFDRTQNIYIHILVLGLGSEISGEVRNLVGISSKELLVLGIHF